MLLSSSLGGSIRVLVTTEYFKTITQFLLRNSNTRTKQLTNMPAWRIRLTTTRPPALIRWFWLESHLFWSQTTKGLYKLKYPEYLIKNQKVPFQTHLSCGKIFLKRPNIFQWAWPVYNFFPWLCKESSTTYNLAYLFIVNYFFWQINLFRNIYMLTPSGFESNVVCRQAVMYYFKSCPFLGSSGLNFMYLFFLPYFIFNEWIPVWVRKINWFMCYSTVYWYQLCLQ